MEDLHRILVESLGDAVMILDAQGRIRYANPAAERLLALTGCARKGNKFQDFVHRQDLPLWEEIFSPEVVRDECLETLLRLRAHDGALRHVRVRAADFRGRPPLDGFLVELCDVAEMVEMRRELERKEEELREFRTIVETANYGVAIADPDGYLLYVNPYFAAVHGYSPRDLVGKNLLVFHSPEQREEIMEINRRLLEEGSYSNLEVWHVHRDGSPFPMLMNAVVIRDEEGNPLYLAATAVDISERKRWEEEREAYSERLEEMVEERTRELAEANRRLSEEIEERARVERELQMRNLELDAFAHSVAHDLRGSVSVVDGFARSALSALREGDEGLASECLQMIMEAGKRMEHFIESLLAYARAGHRQELMEETRLDFVVREVAETLREEMKRAGARMDIVGPLPAVLADHVLLYQVLYNLASNALKYCPAERKPHIELGCRLEGERAILWMRDNGIGISPEDRENIFQPFTRVGDHPSLGMGIGLATVKRAVDNWGGEIWVESTPGEGSTFFFTVPLA
ncbi:sensor histidine kinase [Candidatus Solincola sp.]|jgi:PAS domain S-box-containing protein|nr:PAS domain-containing sensor histidine kinase [Actinomycetota bacterium]MDI7252712.1 PAS domain-containing sensor histidine kinase [Actinomycetota bacterium]